MRTTSTKLALLDEIEQEVLHLRQSPLFSNREEHGYKPVVGEGSPDAHFMFVGEAPGKNEAITGKPFIGAAGRILTELLDSVGLSRDAVYITSIVKDRPPENRDPTREEINLYAPFLDRQVDIIRPNVIVALGRHSLTYICGVSNTPVQPISKIHGNAYEISYHTHTCVLVPLYHPAAALYNPKVKEVMKEDMKVLLKYASISPC